jgi:hypothetical protein
LGDQGSTSAYDSAPSAVALPLRRQEPEERRLAGSAIALRLRTALHGALDRGEQAGAIHYLPLTGGARHTVERAALDQRLDDAPVALVGIDPLAEAKERLEGPVLLARLQHGFDGAMADAFYGAQPESDHLLPGG